MSPNESEPCVLYQIGNDENSNSYDDYTNKGNTSYDTNKYKYKYKYKYNYNNDNNTSSYTATKHTTLLLAPYVSVETYATKHAMKFTFHEAFVYPNQELSEMATSVAEACVYMYMYV